VKFRLRSGGVDEARALCRLVDCPGSNVAEPAVQAESVEDVLGGPSGVATDLQIPDARDGLDCGIHVGRETRHDRERRGGIKRCFRNESGTLDPVDSPVDYDHLAIEVGKGAEAEIAMLQTPESTPATSAPEVEIWKSVWTGMPR